MLITGFSLSPLSAVIAISTSFKLFEVQRKDTILVIEKQPQVNQEKPLSHICKTLLFLCSHKSKSERAAVPLGKKGEGGALCMSLFGLSTFYV